MRFTRIAAILLVLSLCLLPAMAQQQASRYLHLYEVHVALTDIPAFETYLQKVAEAAKKTEAPQKWMSFQGGTGLEAGTYFVVFPTQKWEDLDAWKSARQIVTEAFGETEGNAIIASGYKAMSTHPMLLDTWELMPELSTNFDASRYISNKYQMIRTEVKPEMAKTYISLLERGAKIAQGSENGPMTIRRTSVTGKSFRYLAGTPMDKFADMDMANEFWSSLSEKMGKNAADEFFSTLRDCIVKREIFVLNLRRELSRLD